MAYTLKRRITIVISGTSNGSTFNTGKGEIMFGLWFTIVCILSILLGNFIGFVVMKIWEAINARVIMGFALDCAVALVFATIALIAEIGIPAVALIAICC